MMSTPLVTGLPYRRITFAATTITIVGVSAYYMFKAALKAISKNPTKYARRLTKFVDASRLTPLGVKRWDRVGILQFYPKALFCKATHYMDHRIHEGEATDGFVRIVEWKERFSPVLNCLHSDVSDQLCLNIELLGLHCSVQLPIYANYTTSTNRVNDDEVLTEFHLDSLTMSPDHLLVSRADMSILGEDGRIFLKGIIDEQSEPVVQIQILPYVGCELPFDVIENMRLRTGQKPNLGYMEFNIKKLGDFNPGQAVPMLAKYLTLKYKPLKFEPLVTSQSEGGDGGVVATVVNEDHDVVQEPYQYGKILPQICDVDSVLIESNRASEELSYRERVQKYVKDSNFEWPDDITGYSKEFVNFVTKDLQGSLKPSTHDEILADQSRPSQVRAYEDTLLNFLDDESPNTTFQKGEVYPPKVSAARIINNPDAQARVDTARFTKPIYNTLKDTTLKYVMGFGDGKYLDLCFERQVSIARSRGWDFFETDGTKMDANITIRHRKDLEWTIGRILYHSDYHDEWDRVHLRQYSNRYPKTAKGTPMDLAWSRRSGEGGTSCWNTLAKVLWQYCVRRRQGYGAEEAWELLGCGGGDDGLITGIDEDIGHRTANDLGTPMKIARKTQGDPISFLGTVRIVPAVSLYSPDVCRYVLKAPYCHVRGVPWTELAYRKHEPYVRYYSHIPLIGHYSRAVLRILERKYQVKGTRSSYDELTRGVNGYMMSYHEPPVGTAEIGDLEMDLLWAYVSSALKIELTCLRKICEQLDAAASFEDFPQGYVPIMKDLTIESSCVAHKTLFTSESPPKRNVKEEQINNEARVAPGTAQPSPRAGSRGDSPQESSEENSQQSAKSRKRKTKRGRSVVSQSSDRSSRL